MNNIEILRKWDEIKNIKDIDVLIKTYNINELKSFYKELIKVEIENKDIFNNLLDNNLDKSKLEKIWMYQNTIYVFKIILLKAFFAIEKKEILEQTQKLADELNLILKKNNE